MLHASVFRIFTRFGCFLVMAKEPTIDRHQHKGGEKVKTKVLICSKLYIINYNIIIFCLSLFHGCIVNYNLELYVHM